MGFFTETMTIDLAIAATRFLVILRKTYDSQKSLCAVYFLIFYRDCIGLNLFGYKTVFESTRNLTFMEYLS